MRTSRRTAVSLLSLIAVCTTSTLAAAAPMYTIAKLGFDDLEHTNMFGQKYSEVYLVNAAGQAAGTAFRYNGGEDFFGYSAWLYNGTTTIDVSLTGPEFTRKDGYKSSTARQLNEAGHVFGWAYRYVGGNKILGYATWLHNGADTLDIGLAGPEYTSSDGYKSSWGEQMNEAGQVNGYSSRYNGGSTDSGQTTWLYDGTTTIVIGLTGPEHTRSDAYKYSNYVNSYRSLNEAGQVIGFSRRYSGGSTDLGESVWLYNGATTIAIGLTGPEHTRSDGYKYSSFHYSVDSLNEAGRVIGYSQRYNGGGEKLGLSAWLYNGATTVDIGLIGPDHTRDDGYRYSYTDELNESGQVLGYSEQYIDGSTLRGQSAWLFNGTTTINVGLTGPEHTSSSGVKYSYNNYGDHLNEAGQAIGLSDRYNGSGERLGLSAWLYNGTTTIDVGLAGPEHTRDDGYRISYANQLSEAGQVLGYSARYNGGSADLGQSAWLYDGVTTVDIGLKGFEYTRADGYKFSSGYGLYSNSNSLNEAGHVIGHSNRYNGGSADMGQSAWLYSGTTTIDIGLTGPDYTRSDGYKFSQADQQNEAGQVIGYSSLYGGSAWGQDAWFYDPVLNQTYSLRVSTNINGYTISRAHHLGEDGLVLGTYLLFDALGNELGERAFWFTAADGVHDLGALVDGGLTANGWDHLAGAFGANGRSQILGHGKLSTQSDGQMAYLLTPIIPEPSTFTLVALCAPLAIAGPRRPRSALNGAMISWEH